MRARRVLFLAASLAATAQAASIKVTITGTTKAVYIIEGPVFGYSSEQYVADGTPFTLTYTFDDTRGTSAISKTSDGAITQSGIGVYHQAAAILDQQLVVAGHQGNGAASPGIDATLQIGKAAWDFGESTGSQVALSTSAKDKSYVVLFPTSDSDNHISSYIYPAAGGNWPKNGDWRESFAAAQLRDNASPFSIDNGTVSAKGCLIASRIKVSGVRLGGQWLGYTTVSGGQGFANWVRQWRLAKPSPRGGYVIQQVTRTVIGTEARDGAPITPSSASYWEAWPVEAGAQATAPATDDFANVFPRGSTGRETVSATALFYEGLVLPSIFAVGNSAYAGSRLSSTTRPNLPTSRATLPVAARVMLRF